MKPTGCRLQLLHFLSHSMAAEMVVYTIMVQEMVEKRIKLKCGWWWFSRFCLFLICSSKFVLCCHFVSVLVEVGGCWCILIFDYYVCCCLLCCKEPRMLVQFPAVLANLLLLAQLFVWLNVNKTLIPCFLSL